MRPTSSRTSTWVPATACLALLIQGAAARAAQPPPSAFAGAASCPTCTIGQISQLRLRYTGVEAWSTKLFNPQNNAIIPVTLTGDGAVADQEKLKQDDNVTRVARYGKLAPSLGAKLETMADTDLVDVTIWSNTKIQFPPRETIVGAGAAKGPAAGMAAAASFQATANAEYAIAAAPISAWLTNNGVSSFSASSNMPLVSAKLSKAQIRDLAATDSVLHIGSLGNRVLHDWQNTFDCTSNVGCVADSCISKCNSNKPCALDCGGTCPPVPAGCPFDATWAWWDTIKMPQAQQIAPSSLTYNKVCLVDGGVPRDQTYLRMGAIRYPNQSYSHSQATAGTISNTLSHSVTTSTIISTAIDD